MEYNQPMKIYVIRHGQTEFNVKNLINGGQLDTLTVQGREQAKMAVSLLPKTTKHIYCSSLLRAKQTAEILNEDLQLPITFHDELREVDFGVLSGTPYLKEHRERHRMLDYDWGPSGESVEDVKKRVLKILKEIKSERGDAEALIVAHGGTIRMLHFLQFGEPRESIENASLHSFDIDMILNKQG